MVSQELKTGIKIEMEHAHLFPKNMQLSMAKRIAQDHIKENKHYYTKGLIQMERRLKK